MPTWVLSIFSTNRHESAGRKSGPPHSGPIRREMMAKKWIYALEELGQEHLDLVGRKCANLGEMTKLGMRVPPGFAISVDGFEKYMQVTGLGKRIENYFASLGEDLKQSIQKQMDASRVAKRMIAETPIPAGIVDEIERNYEALCV